VAIQQAAAVNTARYAVLADTRVTVQDGIEMAVRNGFIVDGLLVLIGLLTLE